MGNINFPFFLTEKMTPRLLLNDSHTITIMFKNIIEAFIFEEETTVDIHINEKRYHAKPIPPLTAVLKSQWFEFETEEPAATDLNAFVYYMVQLVFNNGAFTFSHRIRAEYA